jgi:hypothetical protein
MRDTKDIEVETENDLDLDVHQEVLRLNEKIATITTVDRTIRRRDRHQRVDIISVSQIGFHLVREGIDTIKCLFF